MFRFFCGVAVCRVVYPSIVRRNCTACQKRTASGRRASRKRATRPVAAPPTPSPRPKALQNRPRVARVSPQFPLNVRIPSLRSLARRTQAGGPRPHRSTRKSSKRTAPPTDRARDVCAALLSEAAHSPGSLGLGAAHAAAAAESAPEPSISSVLWQQASPSRFTPRAESFRGLGPCVVLSMISRSASPRRGDSGSMLQHGGGVGSPQS